MTLKPLDMIRRRGGSFLAWFFLLFLILVFIRFPYAELKDWLISEAGRKAGVRIVMSDSKFRFPFGLEMTDVVFSSEKPDAFFITPRLERLVLRGSPFQLFSREKSINVDVVNGGTGKVRIIITDVSLSIELDVVDVKAGGLMIGNTLAIDQGTVTMKGEVEILRKFLLGEGNLSLTMTGVFLKNLSPFLPVVPVSHLTVVASKKGQELSINSLTAHLQGITVTADGKIAVKEDLMKSMLSLKAEVKIVDDTDGPWKDYLPLLRNIGGEKDHFSLQLSGDMMNPEVTLDGKSLM